MASIPASTSSSNAAASKSGAWLPAPLRDFWRAWIGELRPIFAPLVERYWVDHANALDVKLDAQGDLPSSLPAGGVFSGRDVRVLLDRASVLTRTVSYPAVVEENLADVIANDLDRQTPFKPEHVYCAQRIVKRYDSADGVARIDVEITLVTRRIADVALARVRERGGSVYSLAYLGASGADAPQELLPESARPARRLSPLQRINVALAVALALIVLAAICIPIYLQRDQAITLQPLVDKARSEAESTRKIEAEYQRLLQEYQFAVGKKHALVPAVDIVDAITKLSPDTTWMRSLELKTQTPAKGAGSTTASTPRTRELLLAGEASSAAKMIELFEQSPFFQNTTQRTQARRNTNNLDEFQIATELKPRVAPELVSFLELPKALTDTATKSAASTDTNMPVAASASTTDGKPENKEATASKETKDMRDGRDAAQAAAAAAAAAVAQAKGLPAPMTPPTPTQSYAPSQMPPSAQSILTPQSGSNGAPMPLPPGMEPPNMPLPNGGAPNMPMPLPPGAGPTPQNSMTPPPPPPQRPSNAPQKKGAM